MSCSGEPASPKDPDTTREESLIFTSWGQNRPVETHPNPGIQLPQMWKICKFLSAGGQSAQWIHTRTWMPNRQLSDIYMYVFARGGIGATVLHTKRSRSLTLGHGRSLSRFYAPAQSTSPEGSTATHVEASFLPTGSSTGGINQPRLELEDRSC